MASISEDKIREMEEEMNKKGSTSSSMSRSTFEKEISQSSRPGFSQMYQRPGGPIQNDSRAVIGARTYNKVAEQLHMQQHPQMAPPPTPPQLLTGPAPSVLPPPPRPNFAPIGPDSISMPGALHSHLQFVPHQLKNPGAPPVHMRLPEPASMMGVHQTGAPVPYNISGTNNNMDNKSNANGSINTLSSAPTTYSSTPAIICAKPTIYSAKPTRRITKPSKDTATESKETDYPVGVHTFVTTVVPTRPIVMSITPSSFKPATSVIANKVGPIVYPQMSVPEEKKKDKKNKKIVRTAGGQVWEDNTLLEWETDDFRVFCGDLGNDVTDEVLTRTFSRYPSFVKARVIRDKRTNKTKGYGFISFKDPQDFIKAMKDMNGKYVGSRPIKLRKSSWKDRNVEVAKKKAKERQRLGLK